MGPLWTEEERDETAVHRMRFLSHGQWHNVELGGHKVIAGGRPVEHGDYTLYRNAGG